jgi:hypothetical protein
VVTTAVREEVPGAPGARREVSWLAGIVVIGFVLPVIYGLAGGFVTRPFEDDWAYVRIVRRFVDAGVLESVGWNDLTLVGQLLVTRVVEPVTGTSVAGLRVQALVLGPALIVLMCVAARRWSTAVSWPVIGALVCAFPVVALYSVTYMVDIPLAFLIVLAVALGMAAAEHTGRHELVLRALAVAAAVAAFSYRQTGAAALIGLAAAVPWRAGTSRRRAANAAIVGAGAVAMGLIHLVNPLREQTASLDLTKPFAAADQLAQAAITVALALWVVVFHLRSPAPSSGTVRWVARAAAVLTGVAGLVVWERRRFVIAGDTVQVDGGNPLTGVERSSSWLDVLGTAIGTFAILLAALAAYRLVLLADDWWRARREPAHEHWLTPPQRVAALSAAAQVLLVSLLSLGQARPTDRHLLPVVLLTALAVPRAAVTRQIELRGPLVAGMAAAALASTIYVVDTMSWTEHRWQIGEQLAATGVPASAVEAGFDFDGHHFSGHAVPTYGFVFPWRSAMEDTFPGFEPCVEVVMVRREGEEPIAEHSFWRVPGLLRGHLYAYPVDGRTCPDLGDDGGVQP